jgi:hypothetical protein
MGHAIIAGLVIAIWGGIGLAALRLLRRHG